MEYVHESMHMSVERKIKTRHGFNIERENEIKNKEEEITKQKNLKFCVFSKKRRKNNKLFTNMMVKYLWALAGLGGGGGIGLSITAVGLVGGNGVM